MSTNIATKGISYWINSVIVLTLMFVVPRIISPIAPLTEQGMHAICIFLALLWAWSFVDFIWPSLLSLIAVGLSGFMKIEAAFTSGFGNSTIIMLFFIFILTAYMTSTGLCKTITYWFITRRICTGRPYVIISVLFFATFIVGSTVGTMAAVLIAWAIAYEMFDAAGFQKGDKLPMFLLIGIMVSAVFGQCVFPFRPLAAITINSLANVTGLSMPYGAFIAASTITCILSLIIYILAIRFIFRPDLKGLRSQQDIFAHHRSQIQYTKDQKIATIALAIIIIGALAPSFFPAHWAITQFFSQFTITSLTAGVLSIIAMISLATGDWFNFSTNIKSGVDWSTLIMLVGSMPAAAIMQSPESGVTTLVNQAMIHLLGNFSPLVIGIVFIIFATLVTQFAHNVVMCIVLAPILGNLALTLGFNPLPIGIFLAFGANIGMATPGASAWGAMIFGQREWIPAKYAFSYTATACIIALITICCIGLPIATAMI